MLKEGVILGERYEIISRIGSGGMADVYKAKDHKLNRIRISSASMMSAVMAISTISSWSLSRELL